MKIPKPEGLEERLEKLADEPEPIELRMRDSIKRRADKDGITIQEQIEKDREQVHKPGPAGCGCTDPDEWCWRGWCPL